MNHRGKLVILLMFSVAIGLSGYAWWHRFQQNPMVKEFWGSDAILVIRYAPTVEFISFLPTSAMTTEEMSQVGEILTVDDQSYVATTRNIANVPGLVHARHGLITDRNYVWNSSPSNCEPSWEFGLRFRDRAKQVTIAFDTSCGQIFWLEGRKNAQLVPLSAKAYHKKRDDWKSATNE